MRYAAIADGRRFELEVSADGGHSLVSFEGGSLRLDQVEIDAHCASVLVDGRSHELAFERGADGLRVLLAGEWIAVSLATGSLAARAALEPDAGPLRISAPMPGRIVEVRVRAGETVRAGQSLLVIEAMKMENELRAPRAGRVTAVSVSPGAAVERGALLAVID